MGVLQNIADRFWITIGQTKKVYPVKVHKYKPDGDESAVFAGEDRGRTLIDDEGNKTFELMNEPQAEGYVGVEDFEKSSAASNLVSVIMFRDEFAPLDSSFNFDNNTFMSEEDIEKYDPICDNALEYCIVTSSYKQYLESGWGDVVSVSETQEDSWLSDPRIVSSIMYIGAGLFFIFVGFAAGETFLKELVEKLSQNTEAVNQLQEQLAQNIGDS